ncbi:MAG: N-acetyltransferase [Blastocatellia bacterium]|nr:MAG: N-acetyltransferase [Blastocatellia bacterium]
MHDKFQISHMRSEHWEKVANIYSEGIATGNATFETKVPTWEQWDQSHLPFARLVAIAGDEILGWAALTPVSKRSAYAGVADVSVYVDSRARAQGCGRTLLNALIAESEANGVWTLQASIFPENVASLELHRKAGFRDVGRRERIGKLNGVWRDTLLLERRSGITGVDKYDKL